MKDCVVDIVVDTPPYFAVDCRTHGRLHSRLYASDCNRVVDAHVNSLEITVTCVDGSTVTKNAQDWMDVFGWYTPTANRRESRDLYIFNRMNDVLGRFGLTITKED